MCRPPEQRVIEGLLPGRSIWHCCAPYSASLRSQHNPQSVGLDPLLCLLMPGAHLFCRRPTAFCSTPLQYLCHCAARLHSRKQAIPSRLRRMTTISAACSQMGPHIIRCKHLHI